MLKVGVVGCGMIGQEHIKRLSKKLQGVQVVAVSDVFEEGARKAAGICGAKVYTDGADLVADPEVEAVVVTSPGFAHKETVLQAIAAGKRVFSEKPLATTAKDCKEIVETEMASGKHLVQVGFNRRYDKGYHQLKEVLMSGKYGEPLMAHCTHRNPVVADTYSTEMAVHDTLIHEIDVMHWLIDDEYESAQVIMNKRTKNALPHLADPQFMIFRTKGGMTIDVEVFVNCKFGYDINCEVVCEEGTVKLAAPATPIIKSDASVATGIETSWINRFIESYDTELQDWVNAAAEGIINGPTAWDGYVAAVTADAFVKAQKSGQIEPIVTGEKPEFYR
ncbi:Gfo/Idh/MocA family protein [Ruminococcus gauvreauii]|uniref:Gfo/Idh/MocA family protein n=1 Tax=Ruminococcus gauvreauii TaxID=438033 RepID=UPI00398434C7